MRVYFDFIDRKDTEQENTPHDQNVTKLPPNQLRDTNYASSSQIPPFFFFFKEWIHHFEILTYKVLLFKSQNQHNLKFKTRVCSLGNDVLIVLQ